MAQASTQGAKLQVCTQTDLGIFMYIDITQINFHQFFQRILLNMFKHTIIQQEMLKITVLIKQRKCFLIVQLEIVDLHFGML